MNCDHRIGDGSGVRDGKTRLRLADGDLLDGRLAGRPVARPRGGAPAAAGRPPGHGLGAGPPDARDALDAAAVGQLRVLVHAGALGGAFPSYRFGTIVLANSFRSPALLAKMAATTQALTGGRLILGLGAGWHETEYRSYGFPYPSPATRIRQLEEAVQVIRAMWTETPASFSGTALPDRERLLRAEAGPAAADHDRRVRRAAGAASRSPPRRLVQHAERHRRDGPAQARRAAALLRRARPRLRRDGEDRLAVSHRDRPDQRRGPADGRSEPVLQAGPARRVDRRGAGRRGGAVAARSPISAISHINVRFADFPRLDGAMRFVEQVLPLLRQAGM